jgi:hypothetical protein
MNVVMLTYRLVIHINHGWRILSVDLNLLLNELMTKYHVTLASGRDFILNSGYDVYQAAYDAYEAACEHDDYLVDVVPIDD